jgi:YVTN family beta-propeller protein
MSAIRRSFLFVVIVVSFIVTARPMAAQTLIDTIVTGHRPVAIVVNQATNRIYVVNQQDYTVSVIDGATDAVIATVPAYNRLRIRSRPGH